jgi:DNA-binding response OmpR family regulator
MACATGADPLAGCRILVVEDEYYIAADLKRALEDVEAIVVGPTGVLDRALDLAGTPSLDAAILDVDLRGIQVYPVADRLSGDAVPFLFLTGYDEWAMPERFRATLRLAKPIPAAAVVRAAQALLSREPTG